MPTVKLSYELRQELLARIRTSENLENFVSNKTALASLNKAGILDLAGKLGIDVHEVAEALRDSDARALRRKDEEKEFEGKPLYTGTVDIDVTIELPGCRAIKKMRAEYELHPTWEFFDINTNRLRQTEHNDFGVGLSIWVENRSAFDSSDPDETYPRWEKNNDLWAIVTDEAFEHIHDEAERRARVIDSERRAARGLPPGDYASEYRLPEDGPAN